MISQRTMALRQILAATDFSKQSDQAVKAAAALAQHFGARLHVFHAAHDASSKKIAREKLEALPAEPIEGIEIVRAVSVGEAAPEIVKYAERENIDLAVLGTHGRSGLARVLMGSVAAAVASAAPCQILTIGPKVRLREEPTAPAPVQSAVDATPASRCLVCAKPSPATICDSCKAYIQGEALERKRQEEKAGHRGLTI